MAYVSPNFRRKAHLVIAVTDWNIHVKAVQSGTDLEPSVTATKPVSVYQPGPFTDPVPDGVYCVEGPHFPTPHSWYARVVVKDGVVVSVS